GFRQYTGSPSGGGTLAGPEQVPRPGDVGVHLLDQRVDVVELHLRTEVCGELDFALLAVEVALEVEDVHLAHRRVVRLERRTHADVDSGGPALAVPDPPPRVHAERGQAGA